MFCYAEINNDYLVTNTHSLTESSTNPNYIAITEEQYTSGDLIGKYYNSFYGRFEIIDMINYMGNSDFVTHYDTAMPLSTKIDNMQVEIDSKADVNHVHNGYASSDDLTLLEDAIGEKANISHTHSEYASASHSHDDYVIQNIFDALSEEVDEKANVIHTHTEYALSSHEHNNYAGVNHNHDTSYDAKGSAASALNSANTYADELIVDEVANRDAAIASAKSSSISTAASDATTKANNALASAKTYTDTAIDTLSEVVADKANAVDLTSHTSNTTAHITSAERTNWNTAKTHANSAHAPANAEPNQNAFSNVVVNGTTIAADSKTDTLTFVAGNNVTITPDATGDSITISSVNTVYTHPSTAGNKHIPAGGSNGQILRWASDGTAVWGSDNNTTYSNATQTSSGLMSDTDKTKLDGIAVGANNNVLPSAGSALGGVKTGGDVTIASGVITVNDDSHNHVISNVDGLQTALNGKAPIFTDASGGVEYGFDASDGVNLLTQISNFGTGLHTIYSQGGVTGNPKTTESWRMIVHKTSPTIGWIMAYGSSGSVYTNYQTAANTFVGWKCIYEATNKIILWSGTAYMQSIDSNPQTITPSKPLSQCRTGWLLLWSDYDAGAGVNDSDFATTFIPKYTPTGGTWGGKAFYCDIPMYVGSDGNNISTEQRCIKPIYVHDDCIKGSYQNTLGGRNDVVLRAIYEV